MKQYEVQEFTLCEGFINTWRDENDAPSYFDTEAEAEAELTSFLKDMREAYRLGHMADYPLRSDYRIVEARF